MMFTSQPKNAIDYGSKYVSKEMINHVPTLMAQAPNRKGNVSKMPPNPGSARMATVGATNVSANKVSVSQPKGNQGAPKANGVVHGVCGCPVSVSRPKNSYGANDGYRKGSSYLK